MPQQVNSTVERGADPEMYQVGAKLRFVEWDDPIKGELQPGDVVTVAPRNGCGLGIDVTRDRDGMLDMVWPTEAILVGKAPR